MLRFSSVPKSEQMPTEFTTRKEIIDFRLKDAAWNVADRTQVIEEFFVSPEDVGGAAKPVLPERLANYGAEEFSDYVLLGKNGKPPHLTGTCPTEKRSFRVTFNRPADTTSIVVARFDNQPQTSGYL
jgi:hypothetical protein